MNVPRQRTDGLIAPLGALGPDPPEGPVGLLDDLLEGPPLQIDLVIGHDPLAAADLPGVGLGVGHQAVGVLEVEHRAGGGVVRPRLLAQEPHRGLVAVEGGAQLDLLHQGACPLVRVTGGLRPLAQLRHHRGGGLELLLRYQSVHLGPGHGRHLPSGDRFRTAILHRRGSAVQPCRQGDGEQESEVQGEATFGVRFSHGTSLESPSIVEVPTPAEMAAQFTPRDSVNCVEWNSSSGLAAPHARGPAYNLGNEVPVYDRTAMRTVRSSVFAVRRSPDRRRHKRSFSLGLEELDLLPAARPAAGVPSDGTDGIEVRRDPRPRGAGLPQRDHPPLSQGVHPRAVERAHGAALLLPRRGRVHARPRGPGRRRPHGRSGAGDHRHR